MPVVHGALTPETAAALRDPHGVVHVMGGFVELASLIGPACSPYIGPGRQALGVGWWRLQDVELLGPDAAITCLWCAQWRQ